MKKSIRIFIQIDGKGKWYIIGRFSKMGTYTLINRPEPAWVENHKVTIKDKLKIMEA